MRNEIISIVSDDNLKRDVAIQLIGDPHLGREFVNGVALERRGEREDKQFQQFDTLLNTEADIVIMMGDLFDKFQVKNEVLMRTFHIINQAAYANPTKEFYMMMGNHDVSRDEDRISSFKVLKSMCGHLDQVYFIDTPMFAPRIKSMLIPYSAFSSSVDVAEEQQPWLEMHKPLNAVFGHWDVDSFGDKDFNLVPLEQLKDYTDTIYTGHIHKPEVRTLGNVTLTVTGSMQPYSHAEDETTDYYITITLDQYNEDPTLYHDKAVRFKLKPGEEIPNDVDALQVAFQMVNDDATDELEVKMEVFSFEAIFNECLTAASVPADRIPDVWGHYKELTNAETT